MLVLTHSPMHRKPFLSWRRESVDGSTTVTTWSTQDGENLSDNILETEKALLSRDQCASQIYVRSLRYSPVIRLPLGLWRMSQQLRSRGPTVDVLCMPMFSVETYAYPLAARFGLPKLAVGISLENPKNQTRRTHDYQFRTLSIRMKQN